MNTRPSRSRTIARALGAVVLGVKGHVVTVEADSRSGRRRFDVVGLPGRMVREAVDRVQAALANSLGNVISMDRHWILNLAPADLDKSSSGLDLPLAMALLSRGGGLPKGRLAGWGFVGELALDGALRPVAGVLPMVMALRAAGIGRVLVAEENGAEAALVDGLETRTAPDLATAVARLAKPGAPLPVTELPGQEAGGADLAVVAGQLLARRACEIAAAGGHHILLVGPPGAGKTMLARALPGLLTPLSRAEALEVTRIHSVAGRLPSGGVVAGRPFVAPHHSVSVAGLVGGGSRPSPGAVSLAHRGVLFLDEMPLFSRGALDALREPLEEGEVTVTRVAGSADFPARFQLVAAMNPCPCGHFGDPETPCRCAPGETVRYRSRIPGPLLDRLDLVVELARVPYRDLARPSGREASEAVRNRVRATRALQANRYEGERWDVNAGIPAGELDKHAAVKGEADRLLGLACERYRLSARAVARTRRVARTIADLEGAQGLDPCHVAEALQYRLRPPAA